MEIQNLNRLNDALFKDVFGQDTALALSFINSVLEYEGTPTFQSIDFIDRELDPVELEGKGSRLDIVGREAKTGAKVNLEVQVMKQEYFGKRSLYYWARLYNDLKRGQDYDELTRTVTINLLDFILFEKESEKSVWHSAFGVYDIKTGKRLTEDLEMHFIELPKWKIEKDVKDMSSIECWVSYFDKKTTKEELEGIIVAEPMIKEAIRRESIFTQDEIRRRKYDLIEKAERDRRGQMKYAIKQGIEQGMKKGREQGTEEGKNQIKSLIEHLISDGKQLNDIQAIIADSKLCEEMLKKYRI